MLNRHGKCSCMLNQAQRHNNINFELTGLLENLNDMNNKLEEIQKSLDMYLETKRQIFPRFYFLSNDDLLEILGQSKNPEAVQPDQSRLFGYDPVYDPLED